MNTAHLRGIARDLHDDGNEYTAERLDQLVSALEAQAICIKDGVDRLYAIVEELRTEGNTYDSTVGDHLALIAQREVLR